MQHFLLNIPLLLEHKCLCDIILDMNNIVSTVLSLHYLAFCIRRKSWWSPLPSSCLSYASFLPLGNMEIFRSSKHSIKCFLITAWSKKYSSGWQPKTNAVAKAKAYSPQPDSLHCSWTATWYLDIQCEKFLLSAFWAMLMQKNICYHRQILHLDVWVQY